jgi:hypothetical protein
MCIAELVVRELEKDAVQCATERAAQDDVGAAPMTRYMMRSVACFQQQGVAFVDTQPHAWQALHCNIALSNVRLVPSTLPACCTFSNALPASRLLGCCC